MRRRSFLGHSIGGILAASAVRGRSAGAEGQGGPMPIIDTHQHLWDLKQFPLTWVKGSTTLDRDFLMSDYVKATAGLNVVRSVYMEVAVEPKQHEEEAEWAVATCRRGGSPMVAAVISGRPASDGFKAYLERFKKNPEIKGLRQVLHGPETPPGYCLDRSFIRGIQRLGELGLSFDLCVRSTDLRDGAKLVDACPNTAFILDHCGNADVRAKDRAPWRADIAAIARRPNIVCKVSGIVASTAGQPWSADDLAPIVNHVLDVFGPDRVVFGGDWPVCLLGATYKQWVDALKAIVRNRSEAEQRKLFHDNAVRVYRLG